MFLALKDTVQHYNIPRDVFDDLISGMEDDLYNNRYNTFDELYVYCCRVASVVEPDVHRSLRLRQPHGRVNTLNRGASSCETHERAYGTLAKTSSATEFTSRLTNSSATAATTKKNSAAPSSSTSTGTPYCRALRCSRRRTYLEEARALLPLLPRRTRCSPAAMIAFYDKILRQIEKQQGDVFTAQVKLNKFRRFRWPLPFTCAIVSFRPSSTPSGAVWPVSACCPAFEGQAGHGRSSSHVFHSATHECMNGSMLSPMPSITSRGWMAPFLRTPVRNSATEQVRPD